MDMTLAQIINELVADTQVINQQRARIAELEAQLAERAAPSTPEEPR